MIARVLTAISVDGYVNGADPRQDHYRAIYRLVSASRTLLNTGEAGLYDPDNPGLEP